jgi:hypothetical protein
MPMTSEHSTRHAGPFVSHAQSGTTRWCELRARRRSARTGIASAVCRRALAEEGRWKSINSFVIANPFQ